VKIMKQTSRFVVVCCAIWTGTGAAVAAPPASAPTGAASAPAAGKGPLHAALAQPILQSADAHEQLRTFIVSHAARFAMPASADAWSAQATELRRRVLDNVVLKGVPREWFAETPRVEEIGRIETGKGYAIRKLRYEGYPGLWVPALLYEPTNLKGKVPAVLNVNGHVGAPGKAIEYKQIRCINLAKRGMLALNLEWIGMGELGGECYAHNRQVYLDLCGRSGVSVFYLLMKRGLDVLLSQPHADSDRVAMTGLSGGGWQTIFFSSLEPRIRLAVPNAGYITIEPRATYIADTGDVEQNPTDLVSIADYSHLTALLAPRPALLIYNAKDDCCFPAARAKTAVHDPILPLYEKFGAARDFQFHTNHDPGTHNYERDNREAFYRFIDKRFLPDNPLGDRDLPCDGEVKKPEELAVGVPKDNANFCSLAAALARDLPRDRCPTGDRESIVAWQKQARQHLAEIVRFKPLVGSWETVREETRGNVRIAWRRLHIGKQWTLPAVEIAPAGTEPTRTAVVVADGGRPGAEAVAEELVGHGYRAVVLDVLLFGETLPKGMPAWQIAEMVAAVGERPLGTAAAQLLAAAAATKQDYPGRHVSLVGVGRAASVIAIVAAALDRDVIEEVTAVEIPFTLKQLIYQKVDYAACPQLFCFGLLEQFDVRELIAMALPRHVRLVPFVGACSIGERALQELTALGDIAETLGAEKFRLYGTPVGNE
jgi:dienelactone hydrolase